MDYLPAEFLTQYRQRTFRMLPGQQLKSKEDAIDFVNQRGFVFFWPITGANLPSLWVAVAGDRPVADAHDDPGHVTWGWKDSLLDKKVWYYAKILRKKATVISLGAAPYFYALSENYGAPEEDYLTQYEQGRLTQEAKAIYETLLENGRTDTVALRKITHLSSEASSSRFERALVELQTDFKILPVAVTDSGAWRYAFAYDIVPRYYPEIPERAQHIPEDLARRTLVENYLRSVGAAQSIKVARLFGWSPVQVERAIQDLVSDGVFKDGVEISGEKGEWVVLKELFA